MSETRSTKPVRLLYLVNSLRHGGVERDLAMICKHIDQSRFQPEVWSLLGGGEHESTVRAAEIKIRCLNRKWSYDPVFALRAAREIARSKADLLHGFLPQITLSAALAKVLWRIKQPLVYYEVTSQRSPSLLTTFENWARRRCTHFIANSPTSERFLLSHGVDPATVRLIPNGHEVEKYRRSVSPDALRCELGAGPDEKLVLFVGRLCDTKRVCDLIDAVASLDTARLRLKVVIAGDGPERESLVRQVSERGLDRVVRFLGMRQDVVELLQAADLFVFPSEVEGLSNATIEAALAGLPIVACDIGGVREVVKHGRDALLVAPRRPDELAVAVQQVLADPAAAQLRAKSAQEHAKKAYAIQSVLPKLYEWYEEILNARPSNGS